MPNLLTPIHAAILTQYPGATVHARGTDCIDYAIGGRSHIYTTVGGGLHYLDGGAWQEINTDFADSSESGYADANLTAQFLAHVGGNTERKVYPQRGVMGEYFTLGRSEYWNGSHWANLNLPGRVRSGQSLSWDGANIAFAIQHTGHGIKYDVTLKNATNATDVRWALSLVGLTWDNWALVSQSTGQVVGRFRVPTMTDANRVTRPVAASYDGQYITFAPDYSGLVYPITMDPTFTAQPGTSDGVDCNLLGDSTTTNWHWTDYNIGSSFSQVRRMLVKFNLTTLPADAVITSNSFYLTITSDLAEVGGTLGVYRQKRAWNYTQATWTIYSTGNNWETAGGFGTNDCEQSPIGSLVYTASETGQKTISLTAATKAALDLGNGWLVKVDTETAENTYTYAGSENATTDSRPKLVVQYDTGGVNVKRPAMHYARLRNN